MHTTPPPAHPEPSLQSLVLSWLCEGTAMEAAEFIYGESTRKQMFHSLNSNLS